MIRHPRPPVPKDFPTEAIRRAEEKIRAAKGVGVAFPELWKKYKAHFERAQFWKCGYCGTDTRGSYGGDVEHYAPKGEVGELHSRGAEETPYSESITGRRCDPPHHLSGYWWRAYVWDNWLLACHVCNRGWKQTLFPIMEAPYPCPDEDTPISALLLHPLEDEDPLDHLDFDEVGLVWSSSTRGLVTLDVCGLDRPSLVDARRQVGQTADQLCRWLAEAPTPGWKANFLGALCDLGAADRQYAGTVRAIARRYFGLSWTEMLDWRRDADAELTTTSRPAN